MSFALSKTELKELGRLWTEYETAVAALRAADEDAVVRINAAAVAFREVIDTAVGKIDVSDVNAARDALVDAIDSMVGDFDMEFDERSEKWQEGDNGQEARAWIDALRAASDEFIEIESPSVDYSTSADDVIDQVVDLSEVPETFAPLDVDGAL
jgi:hypothetical protein